MSKMRGGNMTMVAPAPTSLYEKLGGAPAVTAAAELFYRRVLVDARIANFFDDVDMDRQVAKQAAFLSMVLGGPNGYDGKDMRTAHASLVDRGLTDQHFDAVMEHLAATLRELGVQDEDIASVADVAEGVRPDVLGRPVY
jgi:hemoglobin